MSTSIYQSDELLVTRMAGNCARCGTRGSCVEFGMPLLEHDGHALRADGCLTAHLCLACFKLLVRHLLDETEMPELDR